MSILTAENLAKSYKSRKVVSDVSLTVNSNEIVGLLGPNGAGKTTAIKIISGIIYPDKGDILFNNISLVKEEKRGLM